MDEQDGVNLTPGGLKKLDNLVNLKDNIIADAIRERGEGKVRLINYKVIIKI